MESTTVVPSITLSLALTGGRTDVLADLDRLLGCIEQLPTVSVQGQLQYSGAVSAEQPQADWPEYQNRLVRFHGRELTLSRLQGEMFDLLWRARGAVVPQTTLEAIFKVKDTKIAVHTNIYRLRYLIRRKFPEIEIVTAGNGYYLSVSAND